MRDFIEKNGFLLVSQCSCGGTFRQTFKKSVNLKVYEVVLMPNKSRFELRLNFKTVGKGNADELERVMSELEFI